MLEAHEKTPFDILFLDIRMPEADGFFVAERVRRMGKKSYVIFVSRDLEDVSRLCGRLIVIRDGKIVRDGPREEIVKDMAPWRLLKLEVTEFDGRLPTRKAELVSSENNRLVCRFDHHKYSASEVIGELSAGLDIRDLSVAEPDIEEAVERIYHPQEAGNASAWREK